MNNKLEDIITTFMNKACDYEGGLKVDLDKEFENTLAKLNKLISNREIEARIDEQNRTNFYDTGVAINSEDEWGNPITVSQSERIAQLTELQEGKNNDSTKHS